MSRLRFAILALALLAGVGVTFGMVANPFKAAGKRPLTRSFTAFPREIVDEASLISHKIKLRREETRKFHSRAS